MNKDIFWRLVDESGKGPDVVSMLLPSNDQQSHIMQIETDVIAEPNADLEQALISTVSQQFQVKGDQDQQAFVDVKWSDEDFNLFIALLQKSVPDEQIDSGKIVLDLEDESLIEAIHVVAAARFAPVIHENSILSSKDVLTEHPEYEQGDLVAINTVAGFKLAVIVAIDSVEAKCVLMDDIDNFCQGHDVIEVERGYLLPCTFGDVLPSEEDVLH